ncbi:MAG: hypothetical protein EXR36_07330 [Betaproteobacteria bacterium]|nr:hypothetical protein [Betaproteobacteria bacterium]
MSPIALVPSRLLAAWLCVGHVVVAASVIHAQPNLLGLVLTLVAGLSLYWSLGRHAMQWFARAPVSLRIAPDHAFVVGLRGGSEIQGRVQSGSFVHPWITLLQVRPAGSWWSYHVLLVPGCAGAAEFRTLRTWLRWTPVAKQTQDEGPQ